MGGAFSWQGIQLAGHSEGGALRGRDIQWAGLSVSGASSLLAKR